MVLQLAHVWTAHVEALAYEQVLVAHNTVSLQVVVAHEQVAMAHEQVAQVAVAQVAMAHEQVAQVAVAHYHVGLVQDHVTRSLCQHP